MKKKNLLIIGIMIISLCVMNQLAKAQTCPLGKIWACRYCGSNGLPECKCVEEKNAANWASHVHGCRFPQLVSEVDNNQLDLRENSDQLSNSTANSFTSWQLEKKIPERIQTNKDESLIVNNSGGCVCSIPGYGCRNWDFKCGEHCFKVCSHH